MLFLIVFLIVVLFIALIKVFFSHEAPIVLGNFDLRTTNCLRGLLALLIVLCHSGAYLAEVMPYPGRLAALGAPVVSVFFFLSGYGLMSSYTKKGESYLNGFIKYRMTKLLIPLVLVTTINVLVKLFNGKSIPDIDRVLHDFVYDCPLLFFSWFVYALIFAYAVFYIVFKIYKGTFKSVLAVAVIMILFKATAYYYDIFPFWRYTIMVFPLGMIYCICEGKVKHFIAKSKKNASVVLLTLMFILGAIFMDMQLIEKCEDPEMFSGIIALCCFPLAFVLIIYILNFQSEKHKFMLFLGGISYEIYLFHGVVFENLLHRSWSLPLHLLYIFITVIIGAFLIHKLVGFVTSRMLQK